jgi:transcriptional regulator with XRE-family HTH domain
MAEASIHTTESVIQKRAGSHVPDTDRHVPDADSLGPELLRILIGRQFEGLRNQAKLTIEKAAVKAKISESTIIRIEAGNDRVRFNEPQIEYMLKAYGASEEVTAELLALTAATRARTRSWWHSYTKTALPSWFSLYVTLEDSAETIKLYQAELVPGLLQTRAYAAQIISVLPGMLDEEEIAKRLDARMERQSLLTRARAPRVEVVLSEAAISRLMGMGSQLADGQLRHILDITQKANVDLQIVPWGAGVNPGMAAGGGFNLLHFPQKTEKPEPILPPLAYLDSLTSAQYLAEAVEVNSYTQVWQALLERALSPEDSKQLLITAMEGLPQ